jgi:hypothetical protein
MLDVLGSETNPLGYNHKAFLKVLLKPLSNNCV